MPIVVPQVGAKYRTVLIVARRPPVAASVDAHVAMGALQGQGVRIGNADDFRQGPQVVAASVEADDDAAAVQDPSCSVKHDWNTFAGTAKALLDGRTLETIPIMEYVWERTNRELVNEELLRGRE